MSKQIKKLNEEIAKKIRPSEVRQHYILFKNAEFDVLREAEKQMQDIGIFGKSRIVAVACALLLEELKQKDGKST